ncbi:Ig-like domain-containing protein [Candidatus Saccharibacteria bacterium]|nr:Ig-like domain-containing protein [Candidatus Saccharibacteria bacterium]
MICTNPDTNSVSAGDTTNPTTPQVPSGIAVDGATGEWVSDNPDVATVDQDGRVTGVSGGTTDIQFVIRDYEGNIIYKFILPYTVTATDNPDTLDMLPIVMTIAIFSAISLTGFVSKSIFGRR